MNNLPNIIISWLAFLIMFAVNALANILKFNGVSTAEVSDMYPNLFVPDGLTFIIWSVIYLWLLVFLAYATKILLYQSQTDHRAARINSILPSFWLSCILNAAWMFAWHFQQIELSLIIMISLLASLLEIILRFHKRSSKHRTRDHLLVEIPFLIYLAWVSVATIANITTLLVYLQWDGFGLSDVFWCIGMMVAAAFLGIIMAVFIGRPTFTLVICWALWGIYRNHGQDNVDIGYSALVLIFICLFFAFRSLLDHRFGRRRYIK